MGRVRCAPLIGGHARLRCAVVDRRGPDAPWMCEFLLNEHDGAEWVFRSNPAVRMPLAEVGTVVANSVPILAPEIVLLYKAHERIAKDEADFRAALPRLTITARTWLLRALNESATGHPWATRLRA